MVRPVASEESGGAELGGSRVVCGVGVTVSVASLPERRHQACWGLFPCRVAGLTARWLEGSLAVPEVGLGFFTGYICRVESSWDIWDVVCLGFC